MSDIQSKTSRPVKKQDNVGNIFQIKQQLLDKKNQSIKTYNWHSDTTDKATKLWKDPVFGRNYRLGKLNRHTEDEKKEPHKTS
jgi:hypothetical protein